MNYRSPVAAVFLVSEKELANNRCFLFHLMLEAPGVSAIIASLVQQCKNICDYPGKLPL